MVQVPKVKLDMKCQFIDLISKVLAAQSMRHQCGSQDDLCKPLLATSLGKHRLHCCSIRLGGPEHRIVTKTVHKTRLKVC